MQETRHACKVYNPKEGREHVLFSQRVVQDDEKVSRWAFMDPFLLLFFSLSFLCSANCAYY